MAAKTDLRELPSPAALVSTARSCRDLKVFLGQFLRPSLGEVGEVNRSESFPDLFLEFVIISILKWA